MMEIYVLYLQLRERERERDLASSLSVALGSLRAPLSHRSPIRALPEDIFIYLFPITAQALSLFLSDR